MLSRNLFNVPGNYSFIRSPLWLDLVISIWWIWLFICFLLGTAKGDDDQDSGVKSNLVISSSSVAVLDPEKDEPLHEYFPLPPSRRLRFRKNCQISTTAVLTCEGDISDPQFPGKLHYLVQSLQYVLSNGESSLTLLVFEKS